MKTNNYQVLFATVQSRNQQATLEKNIQLQEELNNLRKINSTLNAENTKLKNHIADPTILSNLEVSPTKPTFSKAFQDNNKYISFKWSHYLPLYDRIFAHLSERTEPVTILEIGVNNGGSLEIWKKLLPEGSKIFGVDIDEKCTQMEFSTGINFLHGDATDLNFIQKHFADTQFDIIIDDGSHLSHHVIKSFEMLFLKLKYGGLYVVEDVHTSYFKRYNGGFRAGQSHMEYFKRIADALHFKYMEQDDIDKVKPELRFLQILNRDVASLSFYDSVIIVEKYTYPMQGRFNGVVTRGKGLVLKELEDFPRFDENSPVLGCYKK